MHAYIAGPMSGIPDFNYPAFRKATAELRMQGIRVTSPVEADDKFGVIGVQSQEEGKISDTGWRDCVARAVKLLANPAIDTVVLLPGWQASRGAQLEVHIARELGKEILLYPSLEPVDLTQGETILEEAGRIVGGDRGDEYGHPRDDFARTAGAWTALFGWDCTAAQVALAMMVVKLSRLQETPLKRDSIVDIAGYARTYEMVLEREGSAAKHVGEPLSLVSDEHIANSQLKRQNEQMGWREKVLEAFGLTEVNTSQDGTIW